MTTEPSWSDPRGARTLCLSDPLHAEPVAALPAQPILSREAFQDLLAFEKQDEDRRLSAAMAFFMFLFGVGCGAVWMLFLNWLF